MLDQRWQLHSSKGQLCSRHSIGVKWAVVICDTAGGQDLPKQQRCCYCCSSCLLQQLASTGSQQGLVRLKETQSGIPQFASDWWRHGVWKHQLAIDLSPLRTLDVPLLPSAPEYNLENLEGLTDKRNSKGRLCVHRQLNLGCMAVFVTFCKMYYKTFILQNFYSSLKWKFNFQVRVE